MSRAELVLAVVLSVAGCSSDAPRPAGPVAIRGAVSSSPSSSSSSSLQPGPASAPTTSPPPAELVTVDVLAFERVLPGAVHSIAFGKTTKAAALGDDVWMLAGKDFTKLPAPPGDTKKLAIFFGRDDQPRLMGQGGAYFRFKDGGWKRAPYELGKLAVDSGEDLYGVLGDADPEVVCKEKLGCIVKRRSGWTMIDALKGTPFVALCGETPWAYSGKELWRLGDSGWTDRSDKVPFLRADGFWAVADDDLWVAEHDSNSIYHYDGSAWTRAAALITGPRAVWASNAKDVWAAGDGGAAHYDGEKWSRVRGVLPGMSLASGRKGEMWIGGEGGLYRGRP